MNIKKLALIIGFSIISACASNEASMDTDESKAETTKAEPAATTEESKSEESKPEDQAMKKESTEAPAEVTATAGTSETETSDTDNHASTCKNGDQVRIITVVYDNDATDTVCEVTYEKSTGVQTLWTANSDRDYCMEQATAFVQKQEGWGWTCSNME